MRKYLAILSLQQGYARRLCDTLADRDGCTFTPVSFTSTEEVVEFCRAHPVTVILADENIVSDGFLSGISGNPALIRLTEIQNNDASEEHLYRYCGIDEIIRRLATYSNSSVLSGIGQQGGRNVKLTGVYSPSLPSVKTACALTMAAIGKRERKTLFLNLEEFSGTGSILKNTAEKSLADAVYYLKQDSLDNSKLLAMICTNGSVDYIPAMPFADDVREAGGDEWVRLIGKIAEMTDYEEIIVDLPQSLYVSLDIIESCDELYVLEGGDSISSARMGELEKYLNRPEHRMVREKIHRIRLYGVPLPDTGQGGDYAEELMYGKFGEALIGELESERK